MMPSWSREPPLASFGDITEDTPTWYWVIKTYSVGAAPVPARVEVYGDSYQVWYNGLHQDIHDFDFWYSRPIGQAPKNP